MANFLETPEGQAWAARYAAEHNGNLPGQNSGESLDEAIANLMWSQDFAGATGQAPSQQDWEEAWWARQSDDSWFKPYLEMANEALRPDFFQDSPAGQGAGSQPLGIGSLPQGSGPLAVPPSGTTTVTNPVTGQQQDWFGRERYTGEEPPSLAPTAGAPAGSGMFSSDYYKQLVGPMPRGAMETPVTPSVPASTGFPVPQGVQFGPPLPPSEFRGTGAFPGTNYATPLSPADAWGRNMSDTVNTLGNPNTYTAQGMIPRTVDYWGRGNARNASSLQYMSDALARNIQGGANNVQNTWRYLNQR